jgi:hypothetical protein
MTTKPSKILQDLNTALVKLKLDYDTRQKILKLFNTLLKVKRLEWEQKNKQNQSHLL